MIIASNTYINTKTSNALSANVDYSTLSYIELLKQEEWRKLRLKIFAEKNCTCNSCKKKETYNVWSKYEQKFISYTLYETYDEFGFTKGYNNIIPIETNEPIVLHLHHKYYVRKKLPWEYNQDCFEVLCKNCHFTLHAQIKVPLYVECNGVLVKQKDMTPCKRCNGAGYLPKYHYFEGGICFGCNGSKFEELKK